MSLLICMFDFKSFTFCSVVSCKICGLDNKILLMPTISREGENFKNSFIPTLDWFYTIIIGVHFLLRAQAFFLCFNCHFLAFEIMWAMFLFKMNKKNVKYKKCGSILSIQNLNIISSLFKEILSFFDEYIKKKMTKFLKCSLHIPNR